MLDAIGAVDGALFKHILEPPHPQWVNWTYLVASRLGMAGTIGDAVVSVRSRSQCGRGGIRSERVLKKCPTAALRGVNQCE
jgi:hypothetical protein